MNSDQDRRRIPTIARYQTSEVSQVSEAASNGLGGWHGRGAVDRFAPGWNLRPIDLAGLPQAIANQAHRTGLNCDWWPGCRYRLGQAQLS